MKVVAEGMEWLCKHGDASKEDLESKEREVVRLIAEAWSAKNRRLSLTSVTLGSAQRLVVTMTSNKASRKTKIMQYDDQTKTFAAVAA